MDPAAGTLLTALGAARGVVCLVGAGGKKTSLYALARATAGRVAVTSTSHMYRYDRSRVDEVFVVTGEPPRAPSGMRIVAYAGPTDTPARVAGLRPEAIAGLWESGDFELVLVKADGARGRLIKAPGDEEPLVLSFASTVIPVVGAAAFGRPLDARVAHRPEILADVAGLSLSQTIAPVHVARLLSSPRGGLKNVGDAEVVPLINMVDDDERYRAARLAAQLALRLTSRFDRVVLAQMKTSRLIEVIRR